MVRPTSGWGAVRKDWAPRVLGQYWRVYPPTVGPMFNPGSWKPHVPGKWPAQGAALATTGAASARYRGGTAPPPSQGFSPSSQKPGGGR
jgi:hypothetical protein